MKATQKRCFATAIAAAGLMSLAYCQMDYSQQMLDTTSAPKITLNGTDVNFTGAQPGILNGQLMVPVRDICEQLGAKVDWDNDIKEVSINVPTNQQILTLDTNQDYLAMVNQDEQSRPLRFLGDNPSVNDLNLGDKQVVIIGDRAYMPFDNLVACLNGTGDWNRTSDTADITAPTTPPDSDLPSPDVAPTPDNTTTPDSSYQDDTPTNPDNSSYQDDNTANSNSSYGDESSASANSAFQDNDTATPDNSTSEDNAANQDNGGVDKDYGNVDYGPVDQHTYWLGKS